VVVRLNGNKVIKQEVFAEGWLEQENAWGRPVDVLVMPDGALLVSDDYAGVIYRISYKK
jgi:glucose/arabinose dehydrogenase